MTKRLLASAACAAALAGTAAATAATTATTVRSAHATGAISLAAPTATLVWRGLDADRVGKVYEAKADGALDGHFTLTVDTGGAARTVKVIELAGNGVWDTVPQGSWAVLGVYRGGRRLNPADEALSDPVASTATYELYAGDYGLFGDVSKLAVTVTFADGTKALSNKAGAAVPAPGSIPPAAGAATTAPATTAPATTAPAATTAPKLKPVSAGPDTAQRIPDFWVALSASVITRNTLGLGRDLALTAGATSNQVLTVTVLERATGCLVEGTWVELRDPDGNPVPNASVQTREGVAYVGGLRLPRAGVYHLWVYAKDAAGGVVLQAYLPVQVKDRQGQAFETLNGRPFTFTRGEWLEGARRVTSARTMQAAGGGDLFGQLVGVFQAIVQGIARSILGPQEKAAAAQATTILSGTKTDAAARVQAVQAKTGLLPAFLVTGTLQAAEAKAAAVAKDRAKLIGNDGAGLIGNDGAGLISQDGASLISQDGGSLIATGAGIVAAGGGNVIANDGAGIAAGRALQAAGAARAARSGACAGGYKRVGAGKVQMVGGSPVLAGSDGKIAPGTLVIGGRNVMPVNGPA